MLNPLFKQDNTATALHEAGHAVAACALGANVVEISIFSASRFSPTGSGHVRYSRLENRIAMLAIAMAGPYLDPRFNTTECGPSLFREISTAAGKQHIALNSPSYMNAEGLVRLITRQNEGAIINISKSLLWNEHLSGKKLSTLLRGVKPIWGYAVH